VVAAAAALQRSSPNVVADGAIAPVPTNVDVKRVLAIPVIKNEDTGTTVVRCLTHPF